MSKARFLFQRAQAIFNAETISLVIFLVVLTFPLNRAAVIFSPILSSIAGLVGGGYYQIGSDFFLYERAAECLNKGIPYLEIICQDNPRINATPGAVFLMSILKTFLPTIAIYGLMVASFCVFFSILPLSEVRRNIVVKILLIITPGFLLGLKSGNMEVFCMTLILLSLKFILKNQYLISAILVFFAITMKIYPIVLIFLLPRKYAARIALASLGYFLFFSRDLIAGLQNTAFGFENSFGLAYHLPIYNDMHPTIRLLDPILVFEHLIYISLKGVLGDKFGLVASAGILVSFIIGIALLKRPRNIVNLTPNLYGLAASVLSIVLIGLGWNWSYRYWIVFLFLPLALTERKKYRELNYLLFAIVITGITQYRISPRIFFIPEYLWNALFSIRHVLQHYGEMYIIYFSACYLINHIIHTRKFVDINSKFRNLRSSGRNFGKH